MLFRNSISFFFFLAVISMASISKTSIHMNFTFNIFFYCFFFFLLCFFLFVEKYNVCLLFSSFSVSCLFFVVDCTKVRHFLSFFFLRRRTLLKFLVVFFLGFFRLLIFFLWYRRTLKSNMLLKKSCVCFGFFCIT